MPEILMLGAAAAGQGLPSRPGAAPAPHRGSCTEPWDRALGVSFLQCLAVQGKYLKNRVSSCLHSLHKPSAGRLFPNSANPGKTSTLH